MPIYEFRCNKCENTFEQLVFSSDEKDQVTCPSCGERDTSRLMSAFSCGPSSKGAGSGLSSGCSGSPGGFT